MITKEQILEDIKKHLDAIDNEIYSYGFEIDISTKSNQKNYLNDFISIKKNYHSSPYCTTTGITSV